MAVPHLPPTLRTARHWTWVHARRHVPFTLYATGTAAVMAWTVWQMIHI